MKTTSKRNLLAAVHGGALVFTITIVHAADFTGMV
jgi:hypothetical protein